MSLTIYLSSSYEDLKDHRRPVYDQLRALRHDVVAMEDYVAADARPLDQCLADVRAADLYVGLFAWRYGHVPKSSNPRRKSVTELEYLEAKAHKKPCLIFIASDKAPWPPDQMDSTTGENDSGRKIRALRDALRANDLVAFFQSREELVTKVVTALARWQSEHSRAEAGVASWPEEVPARPGARATTRKTWSQLWTPGSRLRVRFLGTDPGFAARILRLAQIWSAYGNIHFAASADADAEVRVGFDRDGGSWAYEGTQCLTVPVQQATMNLGWLQPESPIADLEEVVLHEFGHVLGLAHEHNNPAGDIPWDKKKVATMLGGPPNLWDKATIERYVYSTWAQDRFPFAKPFDPQSVMAYFFAPEMTSGQAIFTTNQGLSAGDKEFISRLYPYAAEG